jgi:hypothetical protein
MQSNLFAGNWRDKMDQNKQFFEELLKADGIDPAGPTQSERMAFRKMLDGQVKQKPSRPETTRPSIWRTLMNNRITKFSAAAVILITAAVLLSQFAFPAVTFAKVIKPIFEAKTFAYDYLVGGEGTPAARDLVSGNRIRRTLSHAPNMVLIIDAEAAKILRLDTAGKTAALVNIAGPLEKDARNFIALLRETIERLMADPNFEPEEQVRRQIDGRKAIGYSLSDDRQRMTILADAKTGTLLQIEFEWGKETCILRNFEFNIPIPEDQISMEPPAGYTMQKTQMDLSKLSEKDLIESLRVWAQYLRDDGTFPPQLLKQEYVKQIPLFREKIGPLSIPDAEKEKMGTYFIQGMMFMQILNDMEWHYAGEGVKLGDAETPILWYQPKGSQTYRVIYGDLSVKDVAPENLPK